MCPEDQNPCEPHEHDVHTHALRSDEVVEKTAVMFRAVSDPSRLRMMELLFDGEHCVSELAQETGEPMSTISQRLKVLYQGGLIARKRRGKHIYYSLADGHIQEILASAFAHAGGDCIDGS